MTSNWPSPTSPIRHRFARALRDVDAVFLACGNVPDQVAYECAVIDEAARSGVRRIVKLSARGAAIGSPVAYWDWHGLIERHLQASGIPSVVLQPGFLMTNLLAAAEQVGQRACCSPRRAPLRSR